MPALSIAGKALFSTLALCGGLAGCDQRNPDNPDQAANQHPSSESRSARASSDNGQGSSGASSTSEGAAGSGSAEREVSDSVITTKAKAALLADTTVKGIDINVETNKGVVSLDGTVEDSKQKSRAASIVKGLDGVKSVENKLKVQK